MELYFQGYYQNFIKKRVKKQFKFDEVFFEFINDNMEKFRKKLMDAEYVYYVVNVNNNLWFLCHICLTSWDIIAYDSNIACTAQHMFEQLMEPFSNMLLYILFQARFYPTKYVDLQGPQPF